jgi:hypothetical protein
MKLFSVFLNNIKNNFCFFQNWSSREIFVKLKEIWLIYLIICTKINLVDPGQPKNKNNCYYNFKSRLRAKSWSRGGLIITLINVRIKIIIIVVLKLDLEPSLDRRLRPLTWVNKMIEVVIIVLKTIQDHELGWSLILVNVRIKVVIIIVLNSTWESISG